MSADQAKFVVSTPPEDCIPTIYSVRQYFMPK